MKKSVLLFLAAMMFCSPAFAIGSIDISIGPKIGYQTAKLSYQRTSIRNDFKSNFTIGAFARISGDRFYVQPEVLWFKSVNSTDISLESTGDHVNGSSSQNGHNLNMILDAMNIQVPVMVGYTLLDLDLIKLRVQGGPTANYIIPKQALIQESITTNNGGSTQEYKKTELDTNSIVWGIQGGIGLDVMRFTIDVNYSFGITNVFNANNVNNSNWGQHIDTNGINGTKQNLFMVTVGYKFF